MGTSTDEDTALTPTVVPETWKEYRDTIMPDLRIHCSPSATSHGGMRASRYKGLAGGG